MRKIAYLQAGPAMTRFLGELRAELGEALRMARYALWAICMGASEVRQVKAATMAPERRRNITFGHFPRIEML